MGQKSTYQELEQRIRDLEQKLDECRQKAHNEMESKVEARTLELTNANTALKKEIEIRGQREEYLKRYKCIVSFTPDGISLLDKDYKYMIVNDSYEQISGVGKEDLIGKTVAEYLGQDVFQEYIKPHFDRCLQGEIVNYQAWFDYPNLERKYMDVTYYPYTDKQKRIVGVVANTREITRLKQAEEALKESEQRYRGLFDCIRDAILVTDTNRRIIDCNPAFESIFGYTLSEIKGEKTWYVYEDEGQFHELGQGLIEYYNDSWFVMTINYRRKDGQVFPGETGVFFLKDKKGEVIGYVGLIRDISDRKKAEEALRESEWQYRTLVENAFEGIGVAQDSVFKWVNPRMIDLWGRSAEELTSRPLFDFVHPDDREMVWERHEKRLQGMEELPQVYPFRVLTSTQEINWVMLSVVQIHWKDKSAALCFFADLSEQKRVEQELETASVTLLRQRSNYYLKS